MIQLAIKIIAHDEPLVTCQRVEPCTVVMAADSYWPAHGMRGIWGSYHQDFTSPMPGTSSKYLLEEPSPDLTSHPRNLEHVLSRFVYV